jgi:hypothetical protein
MVHVVQLLDPFALAPDIEVVEAFLPDVLWGVLEQIGLGGMAAAQLRQHATRRPHPSTGLRAGFLVAAIRALQMWATRPVKIDSLDNFQWSKRREVRGSYFACQQKC